MYQQIYIWMNRHFIVLSAVILILLFVLEVLSAVFRKSVCLKWIYNLNAVVYFLALLFLTLGSRSRYDQPILDLKLHLLRLEQIWQKDVWILQGDVGNIILFFPFGMISQKFLGRRIHWYGCAVIGGGFSICIEILQYIFRCGYCDINDFLYNVIGVILGYCIGFRIQKVFVS